MIILRKRPRTAEIILTNKIGWPTRDEDLDKAVAIERVQHGCRTDNDRRTEFPNGPTLGLCPPCPCGQQKKG